MDPQTKSSLLWGVVGALAFLALVQALQLLTDATVTLPVALLVAILVGAAAGAGAYWLERRLGLAAATVDPDGAGEKEQS
jgi:uncharacterized membrane protein YhhN